MSQLESQHLEFEGDSPGRPSPKIKLSEINKMDNLRTTVREVKNGSTLGTTGIVKLVTVSSPEEDSRDLCARLLADDKSLLRKQMARSNIGMDDPRASLSVLRRLDGLAAQLYNNNFFGVAPQNYLGYLGGETADACDDMPNGFDAAVLRILYMEKYRWNANLLSSLRLLCGRLFFKGESQDIDRVLQSFSESWYQAFGLCNHKSLFGNSSGVYLVAYSLIMLNTDLHTVNDEGKMKRISKSGFVRNTLSALEHNHIEIDRKAVSVALKEFYASLSRQSLALRRQSWRSNQAQQVRQTSTGGAVGVAATVPNSDGAGGGDGGGGGAILREVPEASEASEASEAGNILGLKNFAFGSAGSNASLKGSVTHKGSVSSLESSLSTLSTNSFGFAKAIRAGGNARRMSVSSRGSVYSCASSVMSRFTTDPDRALLNGGDLGVTYNEEEGDIELEMEGPPWTKEGILKVRMPPPARGSSGHKFIKQTQPWKEYFTVVSEGQLRLFTFNQKGINNEQGDGDWTSHANCAASVNLINCVATVDSSAGQEKGRKPTGVVWVLRLPLNDARSFKHHRKIIFNVGTIENAKEFCDTCNFWAARSTMVPTEDTLSSIEYGWSESVRSRLTNAELLKEYLGQVKVEKWQPLICGQIPTEEPMVDQLRELVRYYRELETKYSDHKNMLMFEDSLERIVKNSHRSGNGYHNRLGAIFGWRTDPVSLYKNVTTIRSNYSNRLNYLRNEVVRYRMYIEMLQSGIKRRNKKMGQFLAGIEEEEGEE